MIRDLVRIWILLCHFFLATSIGTFFSASCRLSPLSFGRELDGWSSHWWRSVDGRKSCCRLVKMVLVK